VRLIEPGCLLNCPMPYKRGTVSNFTWSPKDLYRHLQTWAPEVVVAKHRQTVRTSSREVSCSSVRKIDPLCLQVKQALRCLTSSLKGFQAVLHLNAINRRFYLSVPLEVPASHAKMRITLPVAPAAEGSEFLLTSNRNCLKPHLREMRFSYLVQQNTSSVFGTSLPAA